MALTYGMIAGAKADATAPNYGRNADGYGRKIPTRYWVKLATEYRWRRVYMAQFSNTGSPFVVVNGEDVWLNATDLEVALIGA